MKIMLAMDDSPHSRDALESVLQRPWPEESHVQVLVVLEPFHPDYAGWDPSTIQDALDFQVAVRKEYEKFGDEAVRRLRQKFGSDYVSFELKEGRVKDTIIDTAHVWGADLLVLGSHGRSGIQKFLLGSVSQAVVAHAPCSVEIVKKKAG
ncbi:MAG: universal stress protein [Candidatus Obscuribacterales bacterium]|nr:universal stress protein [Candidatus Obscuribacterales bacterium]